MKTTYSENGFTLIELIVSLGILAIVIPSFFAFLNNAIFKVKFNSNITNAFFLTQQKAEELLDKGFSATELTDRIGSNNSNLNFKINKNQIKNNLSNYAAANFDHYAITTLNNKKYYIIWNVADTNTINSLTTLKAVVVITFWIEQGKGHQVAVETFIRDNS